jgi:hypothetical protein
MFVLNFLVSSKIIACSDVIQIDLLQNIIHIDPLEPVINFSHPVKPIRIEKFILLEVKMFAAILQ